MSNTLNKNKLIFIHGYMVSSQKNWYPEIKELLDAENVEYSIPDFPGQREPKSKDWLDIIHKEVTSTDKPVILIGHSLGTRAILLYLDTYKTNVEQVILVAPVANETKYATRRGGKAYPDFFEYKINLIEVKKLAKKWNILFSTDDTFLDYTEHGVALSEEMGVELTTFTDRDHFIKGEDAGVVFEEISKKY